MSKRKSYHHGDLYSALLKAANSSLQKEGVAGLSLRKLSDQVGVSHMGAYHHFKNKHELLCAVAAQGFQSLQTLLSNNFNALDLQIAGKNKAHFKKTALATALYQLMHCYVNFALQAPEQYELMFGRTLWKNARPTEELKSVAYGCFKQYAQGIEVLLTASNAKNKNALRVAQISWSTLHGLSRLFIDGIYSSPDDLEQILQESRNSFLALML